MTREHPKTPQKLDRYVTSRICDTHGAVSILYSEAFLVETRYFATVRISRVVFDVHIPKGSDSSNNRGSSFKAR